MAQAALGNERQAGGSRHLAVDTGHWTLDSGQLAADRAQRAAGSRQRTVRVGLSGDSSKQSWLFRLFVTAVFGSIACFTCEVDEQTLNIAVYLPFTLLTHGVGLPMRCSVLQSKDGTNKNSHRGPTGGVRYETRHCHNAYGKCMGRQSGLRGTKPGTAIMRMASARADSAS